MKLDKDAYEGRKEVWAPIPGYEGMYDVSTIGRVRSYLVQSGFDVTKRLEEPTLRKPQTSEKGYLYVVLRKDGKDHKCYINNLMGKTFIPNPENKPEINHIDGIKTHNVLSNLEWNTGAENMAHARRTGLWDMEGSLAKALEAWRKPVYCYELDDEFDSVASAASYFGVTLGCITYCCQGKNYNVKGYHICYAEDREWLWRNIDNLKAIEGGKKRVKAINVITGEERLYPTRQAASKDLNIPDSYISNIIAGRSYQTRNWTFVDNPIFLEGRHEMEFLNAFPGYEFKEVEGCVGKQNMYRGTNLGFGGYVYYEEGMYGNVALLDIQSMHPASIISLNKFGKYTQKYKELRDLRVAIKHHDLEKARGMMGGALAKYLTNEEEADSLAQAAKLILNSTYGFCSATFDNPFLDSRDKNNIVALKGALLMRTLQDEVQQRGFTVAHIKTDSIKIPDATPEIVQFCIDFVKPYGYVLEFEGLIEKMCLVNGSTYIAKFATPEKCQEMFGCVPSDNKKHGGEWSATAKQFQVPYVFKTLFSKEPIVFEDLCETFETKTALYLDKNEDLPDVTVYEKQLSKLESKYKDGLISDRLFEDQCVELDEKIEVGHDYHFIGRVGQFCPIKPGCGGAYLYRKQGNKYYAATGTTGYRWLESTMVKELGKEGDIDRSYYDSLVDDAVEAISKYGDFELFASDDPYIREDPKSKDPMPDFMNIPEKCPDEVPWD